MKSKLIDLDEAVINALKLFSKEKLPKINIKAKKPLVVGSGNAAVTGEIIFNDYDAVFADEGTYKHELKIKKGIDLGIIISASGGKHAPIIAKELKKKHIKAVLITNTENSLASRFVDKVYVFPKNIEPYTYNTSTYMGMIIGKTKENPKKILQYIKNTIKPKIPKNLKKYDSYYLIVPEEFDNTRELFLTKFDELFGSKVSGRVFTLEQTKHAKTIIPSKTELFISFRYKNRDFGINRLNLPLPKWAKEATMMAIGYYVIGQIQKQDPQYFKNNILNYTKQASKIFKQKIKPIVE